MAFHFCSTIKYPLYILLHCRYDLGHPTNHQQVSWSMLIHHHQRCWGATLHETITHKWATHVAKSSKIPNIFCANIVKIRKPSEKLSIMHTLSIVLRTAQKLNYTWKSIFCHSVFKHIITCSTIKPYPHTNHKFLHMDKKQVHISKNCIANSVHFQKYIKNHNQRSQN